MCFSATASFVAGGTLAATGGLTLIKAKTKKELPLASIPLFFGIQQTIEGVIWLSFGMPTLSTVMTYAYLFFAYVFWPVFVPIAVLLVETHPLRRKILKAFSVMGFIIGLYLLYFLIVEPSKAHIFNQSIAYDFRHMYDLIYIVPYVVVTTVSGMISSHRILNLFGVAALVAFAVSQWLYSVNFVSVWCFLAAVLSVIVFWFFKRKPVAARLVETEYH